MGDRKQVIEEAWENRASLNPAAASAAIKDAVASVINDLDNGRLRVAEKTNGEWATHQWLKKAVLLSFRLTDNAVLTTAASAGAAGDYPRYYDKVPTKFGDWDSARFAAAGFRGVPPAAPRRGAFVARNV